jgi:hypothetical protein
MLPHGMSIEGLGLRPPALMSRARTAMTPMAMAAPAPAAALGRLVMSEIARPSAQAKGSGVLGRAFGAPFKPGRVTSTPADVVRGRIIKHDGKTITIHLEVFIALDWDESALAAATAFVGLEDGTTIAAKVVIERTTRGGRLLPGQHAKLALLLDREYPGSAQFIRFEPDFGLYIPLT